MNPDLGSVKKAARILFLICLVLLCSRQSLAQGRRGSGGDNSITLSPFSCCDGQYRFVTLDGHAVWQVRAGHAYLYFDVPGSFNFIREAPVYLKITYYDQGYGVVCAQYDSAWGNQIANFYTRSETHTRSSRVNTRTLVDSYHELLLPQFAGRQNGGADFRLCLEGGSDVPLSVKSVTLQSTPFDDPQFLYVLTKPWLSGYSGPSESYVDRSTLNHKVMVGYQGWFRTPNDLADKGWRHWCNRGAMEPENFTVDMWPDLTEFSDPELYRAGGIFTRSGQPAHLFSSVTQETVHRHFQWMRKYNIDGAFLQRFVHPNSSGAWGHDEWVLHHVREAANQEGRIWAIEYDVSSLGQEADPLHIIKTDWQWLVDVVKILDDPRYALEGGRPVIFIWGLPFPSRNFQVSTADDILDFFKNDPTYGNNYVIGGIPHWWRNLSDWQDHIQQYDGVLTWMPQSQTGYRNDYRTLRDWGIDYFPHVWPGFSWANLQRQTGNTDLTSRQRGTFFWNKINQALRSGAGRLFVGMFDEYDEGTAIMPMTDDPPDPPSAWGRFLTNDGRPSDWWMSLTGEARAMLLGHRSQSWLMPSEHELANRSNIGPEAWIDLGKTNEHHQLYSRTPADGDTLAEVYANRDCRRNASAGSDSYFYFDVDNDFAYQVNDGLDVTIQVEYLDRSDSVGISLEYDSINGPYTLHPKTIRTRGTGEWRTVRFEIRDAFLGDRQNNGSDFRVRLIDNTVVHIDHVWIRKEMSIL